MLSPKVVLLIFVSGKIVLTGAKVGQIVLFTFIYLSAHLGLRLALTFIEPSTTSTPSCRNSKVRSVLMEIRLFQLIQCYPES